MDSLLTLRMSGTDYEFTIGPRTDGGPVRGPDRIYCRFLGRQKWDPEPGMVGDRPSLVRRLARKALHHQVVGECAEEVRGALQAILNEETARKAEAEREAQEQALRAQERDQEHRRQHALSKAMKCRKRAVELRCDHGRVFDVRALEAGGLAHHRTPGKEGLWTVTHVASRLAVNTLLPSREASRRLHAALLELGDWTVAMPDKALLAAARKIL